MGAGRRGDAGGRSRKASPSRRGRPNNFWEGATHLMDTDRARQPGATAPLAPTTAATDAAATVRADPLGVWTGRRPKETAEPLMRAAMAGAARAAEHALWTCRAVLDTNRAAVDVLRDAARRQQETVFTAARAALSASQDAAAAAQVQGAWRSAAAALAEAGDRGVEVMRSLVGVALEAQRSALAMQHRTAAAAVAAASRPE